VLVWTRSAPDRPSGSPAILAEILRHMEGADIEVVSERMSEAATRDIAADYPISRIAPQRYLWPFRRGARIKELVRLAAVPLMVMYGVGRVLRFRPSCILTIYFDFAWILSSYLLSLITRVPLVYYVHDPYRAAAEYRGGLDRRLARFLEPRSLRHACVAVLYPSLQEIYKREYGLESFLVRHASFEPRRTKRPRTEHGRFVVGFAGTIYDNNRLLMAQLGRACAADSRIELRLFTNVPGPVLASLGLSGPRVSVRFERSHAALIDGLSGCDLLYLPLTFGDTPELPEVSLRTVLPTKAVDYLLAGPDILVHCPEHYEMAQFFSHHRAAHVLSSDAPGRLEQWLGAWTRGEEPEISEGAMQQAFHEFAGRRNVRRMTRLLRAASRGGRVRASRGPRTFPVSGSALTGDRTTA
jgi:hypothetical protein